MTEHLHTVTSVSKLVCILSLVLIATGAPLAGASGALDGQTSPQEPSSQSAQGMQPNEEAQGPQKSPGKQRIELEEVVVTGSRLKQSSRDGAQDVRVFSRDDIERSGESSVATFLNTLPSVSLASTETVAENNGGASVSLRGLPLGTTLVLLNGRRLETSGIQGLFGNDFFDLNNIPLAAVEQIDVVADGSSAVYGSDAIAGVVNIKLKKSFDGAEASVQSGWAKDLNESNASLAIGHQFESGGFSVIGSFQRRGSLDTSERPLTASNDYTAFGGPNNNFPACNPGDVFTLDGSPLPGAAPGNNASYAAVTSASRSGKPSFADFAYGSLNSCALLTGSSLIPATRRAGVFAQGSYELQPGIEVFTELLYSHVEQHYDTGPTVLLGEPGAPDFTVSASNPYNPFGIPVGVSESLDTIRTGIPLDTQFFRPLVGLRGQLSGGADWEVTAWGSADWATELGLNEIINDAGLQDAFNSANPATALNPFIAGPPAPQTYLQSFFSNEVLTFHSRDLAMNGFLRGTLFSLPAGPIEYVVGAEYDKSKLAYDEVFTLYAPPETHESYVRQVYSGFAEARVPVLASSTTLSVPQLALTIAGRYDHYDDFGSTSNPQLGLEWRPDRSLLLRATYATAFKAPPLPDLHLPVSTFVYGITDPRTGTSVAVPASVGGNADLKPLMGESHTFGVVYSSAALPDLRAVLTYWHVSEHNAIQSLEPQFIVDNEDAFPGRVTRDASGAITSMVV